MKTTNMTVFMLMDGTRLYSEKASFEDTFLILTTKDTCILQLTQKDKGFNVNAIPADKLLLAPSKLCIPMTAVAQMSDCTDQNVVTMCRGILAAITEEKPLVDGSKLKIVRRK